MTDKWNGQGLPPVGEICEILWNGVWVKAIIKFLGSNVVVFDLNGEEESSYYTTDNHCRPFRPLKSEAERKRDEEIEKFQQQVFRGNGFALGETKETLIAMKAIEAGYRKVNELTDERLGAEVYKRFLNPGVAAEYFGIGAKWARSQIMGEES
jgi:hypothetical protein